MKTRKEERKRQESHTDRQTDRPTDKSAKFEAAGIEIQKDKGREMDRG